jgi:hypothetical protein
MGRSWSLRIGESDHHRSKLFLTTFIWMFRREGRRGGMTRRLVNLLGEGCRYWSGWRGRRSERGRGRGGDKEERRDGKVRSGEG